MPRSAGNRHPRIARSRGRRSIAIEPLEPRHLFAAIPLGATPLDTAEFLLGRVAVVPVLFESNGSIDANTENWTPQTIQAALDKVHSGVNWWAQALDQLGTAHSLEFVIDETFARQPVSTGYEPISRLSQEHTLYVGAFLESQGLGGAGSLEAAIRQFNHETRLRLGTDWAFTIFLVNSANDDDGQFAAGSEFNVAFAYPGGLYMVVPSTRPASTITHEMGHIFWARDEYTGAGSWTDRRGYYNAQNLNAANNPTPGFVQEPSIMRSGTGLQESFASFQLPESTRAMLGWRDSDGDGIFDLADVPLSLEGTGVYDASAGVFSFEGFATAVPLPNQNSSGPQNDITLNRVDRIEYRVDGGTWQTAVIVGKQAAPVAFAVSVAPYSNLELRAIDDRVGVTSEIFSSRDTLPLLAGASLGGVAFVRGDSEQSSVPQPLLGSITATVTRTDGVPLLQGVVEPDTFSGRGSGSTNAGVTLTAIGHVLDGRVGAVNEQASTGNRALGYYNTQTGSWHHNWTPDKKLQIRFDQPVGVVELDAIGLGSKSGYGRLEAYDAQGNLLTRTTTAELRAGQVETMRVDDSAGRIASVLAFGHAWSEVGLDHLRYGAESQVTADADGIFRFSGLPSGTYTLQLNAERPIYQPVTAAQTVTLGADGNHLIAAAFDRVRSPWNNPSDPFDVNGNSTLEPLDALLVLNELARHGSRVLSDAGSATHFVDTNDDGLVTPLDALWVLNEIARRSRSQAASEGEAAGVDPTDQPAYQATDAVLALWCVPEERKSVSGLWGNADAAPEIFDI